MCQVYYCHYSARPYRHNTLPGAKKEARPHQRGNGPQGKKPKPKPARSYRLPCPPPPPRPPPPPCDGAERPPPPPLGARIDPPLGADCILGASILGAACRSRTMGGLIRRGSLLGAACGGSVRICGARSALRGAAADGAGALLMPGFAPGRAAG